MVPFFTMLLTKDELRANYQVANMNAAAENDQTS